VNVTVDELRVEPGAGDVIWASTTAPGVLVIVGMSVLVDVAVAVGVLAGVDDGPTVGDPVGVDDAVGVRLGVTVAPGPAGVEVATPGP